MQAPSGARASPCSARTAFTAARVARTAAVLRAAPSAVRWAGLSFLFSLCGLPLVLSSAQRPSGCPCRPNPTVPAGGSSNNGSRPPSEAGEAGAQQEDVTAAELGGNNGVQVRGISCAMEQLGLRPQTPGQPLSCRRRRRPKRTLPWMPAPNAAGAAGRARKAPGACAGLSQMPPEHGRLPRRQASRRRLEPPVTHLPRSLLPAALLFRRPSTACSSR